MCRFINKALSEISFRPAKLGRRCCLTTRLFKYATHSFQLNGKQPGQKSKSNWYSSRRPPTPLDMVDIHDDLVGLLHDLWAVGPLEQNQLHPDLVPTLLLSPTPRRQPTLMGRERRWHRWRPFATAKSDNHYNPANRVSIWFHDWFCWLLSTKEIVKLSKESRLTDK